jgi:hypothetical protein
MATDGVQQPEPKEETKQNAKKMGFKDLSKSLFERFSEDFNSRKIGNFNLNIFGDSKNTENGKSESELKKITPNELLGQIYKALVRIDSYRKTQYEENKTFFKTTRVSEK